MKFLSEMKNFFYSHELERQKHVSVDTTLKFWLFFIGFRKNCKRHQTWQKNMAIFAVAEEAAAKLVDFSIFLMNGEAKAPHSREMFEAHVCVCQWGKVYCVNFPSMICTIFALHSTQLDRHIMNVWRNYFHVQQHNEHWFCFWFFHLRSQHERWTDATADSSCVLFSYFCCEMPYESVLWINQ